MSLADEMRNISITAANTDAEFNEIYEDFIGKIRAKAEQGLHDISWYDSKIYHNYNNPNRDKLLEQLKRKLEYEGFRIVEGGKIGKPVGNCRSEYVVW